jgi:hypothetical protein
VDSPTGPRLIFRISGPNGLNYHQLLIAPSPLGDLKIADIDIMVTNELLSRTLQRILEQALVQAGKGNSIKESRAQVTQFIGQMQKLLIDGKPSEAYSFYDMLPESVRAERAAQVIRIQAAVPLGEQQLNKAIDDYRTTFKDDPNVDLFLIRIFTMQNQFDRADDSIARLDRWAGGDPVLNLPRSNVALKRGDLARARALAEEAARREPTLCAAHQQLLVVALQTNDHAETLRLLRLLRDQFKMSFPDLSKSPEFAEFIKTDEYRQWRGAAPKSQPAAGSTTRPGFKF